MNDSYSGKVENGRGLKHSGGRLGKVLAQLRGARPSASGFSGSWQPGREVFRRMPRRSMAVFLAGVACLFTAVGSGTDLFAIERSTTTHLFVTAASNGILAATVAWASIRGFRVMMIVAAIAAVYFTALNRIFPQSSHSLSADQVHSSVVLHAVVITVFVVCGYLLFIAFVRAEGKRFFAAHTEIELAAGIQRALVPPLTIANTAFEAYGISLPSGAIGGDLLDVVPCGASSFAYVADVAGHGVKAGVLMSMIKASVRTHFASSQSEEGILESLNEVLYPLTDAPSYATFAFVSAQQGKPFLFSLAGHLPIFHFRSNSGTVQQHSIENFPIAMFPGARFETATLAADRGDVLAIVTDGLTELTNKHGEEIGSGYIENVLRNARSYTLRDIAEQIFTASNKFGAATDDRTLLLIRVA